MAKKATEQNQSPLKTSKNSKKCPSKIRGNPATRLVYQSRKRGTLENDLLLLSPFARDHLRQMNETKLKEYDKPHTT
ncbi:hypothetical protein BDR04DRAFT_1104358 [Suillus decipiens]|nr:hypothetical protein BDR04DRAFT_1104358 [Suillus decipiens]